MRLLKLVAQPGGKRAFGALTGPGIVLGLWMALLTGSAHATETNRIQAARPGRGFSYHHDQIPEGPWSVHILKIDLANTNLALHTSLARGSNYGLTPLSDHIKTLPPELGTPVAAVNGDYYSSDRPYVGDPKGLQILEGELVSAPCDWSCFYLDAAGRPRMTNVVSDFRVTWADGSTTPFGLNEERGNGAAVIYTPRIGGTTRTSGGVDLILEKAGDVPWGLFRPGLVFDARVRALKEGGDAPLAAETLVLSVSPQLVARLPKLATGLKLKISTETTPNLKGVTTAIGGGPAIVRNGKALKTTGADVRHPRTAIGWNQTHLFLVEVDGRQPNLSVGMTFPELAAQMIQLGCGEAMNLDGGGSATFWVYGQVMNSPSEGKPRGMANALILLQKGRK